MREKNITIAWHGVTNEKKQCVNRGKTMGALACAEAWTSAFAVVSACACICIVCVCGYVDACMSISFCVCEYMVYARVYL